MKYHNDTKAVTPILAILLILPSMTVAAIGVAAFFHNTADWTQAEADRAAFHADCARAIVEGYDPDPQCWPDSHTFPPGACAWDTYSRTWQCKGAPPPLNDEGSDS